MVQSIWAVLSYTRKSKNETPFIGQIDQLFHIRKRSWGQELHCPAVTWAGDVRKCMETNKKWLFFFFLIGMAIPSSWIAKWCVAMCDLSLAMDCFQWQQSFDLDFILECLAQFVGHEEVFKCLCGLMSWALWCWLEIRFPHLKIPCICGKQVSLFCFAQISVMPR